MPRRRRSLGGRPRKRHTPAERRRRGKKRKVAQRAKVGYARHKGSSSADVRRDFHKAVNMSAAQLRAWLAKPESKQVGFTYAGSSESVGHASGRKIVRMLTGGRFDEAHARKVIGYVHRHLAQRPSGDISRTPWRYSLMNWGHDPLRR